MVLPFALCQCDSKPQAPTVIVEAEPTVSALIDTFLDGGGTYRDVPFSEVIKASTGKRVIPIDPNDAADSAILDEIGYSLDTLLKGLNQDDSPSLGKKRVSEISPIMEARLKDLLANAPGLSCGEARTREGNLLRVGYPDLRIVHEESGRVVYLEPKLVDSESLDSSLRTFYFSPKAASGKILSDSHHLVVGIEHDGKTGEWEFLRWHLVDLANSRVRLKAEFQASNKELYVPNLIIRKGGKTE